MHKTSATPIGYTPPASWVIAQSGGGMGATSGVVGTGGVNAGNLAGGLNAVAPLTGSGDISAAALALVVSAVANLTGGGDVSAGILGLLNAAAALAGDGNAAGAVTALAHLSTALAGSGGAAADITAKAGIAAAIVVTGDLLSTANIADAILDEPDGVEPGLTMREALRLIAAATAGKVSGASGTTITIRSALADHRNRIVATVDASGNRTAITTDLT